VKTGKIGLIGAMNEEVELILQQMEERRTHVKAGIEFHEGEFLHKRVIVCKSGVGKVNAAVCTQLLIDSFDVRTVIFTGVAGALHPDLDIGDIVISTDCMQHDMDVTALGFSRGVIPYQENSIFLADPNLLSIAYKSCSRLFKGKALKGRILSGDQFIANRDTVKQLYVEMEGVCTEMEGASVAQVCFMNDVPYVIIRSMSDKADGSADTNFIEFTALASRNSFLIVEDMIKQL
jgi:adenosylhomocysteine nucleosidase